MTATQALSRREAQVLALAAEGLLDKEISCRLGISSNTLRTYWTRVRSKLGEHNRVSLVRNWLDTNREPKVMPSDWTPFRRLEIDFRGLNFSAETAREIVSASDPRESGLRPVLPEDFPKVAKAFEQLIGGAESSVAVDYRVVFERNVFAVNALLTVARDDEGRIEKLIGYAISTLVGKTEGPDASQVGEWIGGLHAPSFCANPQMCRIFGLDPEKDRCDSKKFRDRVDPSDYKLLRELADEADRQGGGFIITNMRVRPDNQPERRMKVHALIDHDVDGGALIIGQYVPGQLGPSVVTKV